MLSPVPAWVDKDSLRANSNRHLRPSYFCSARQSRNPSSHQHFVHRREASGVPPTIRSILWKMTSCVHINGTTIITSHVYLNRIVVSFSKLTFDWGKIARRSSKVLRLALKLHFRWASRNVGSLWANDFYLSTTIAKDMNKLSEQSGSLKVL